MDCTNCGAAIPPKEEESAGTCYNCGESLGFQPFVSETGEALDRLEQRVREVRFHELAGGAEVADDIELGDSEDGEDIDFEENRRSLSETHEQFAPPLELFGSTVGLDAAAERHPSSTGLLYRHYKVWTGKSWDFVWVYSATSKAAVDAIFASSIKPVPVIGRSFGTGDAFFRNRGKAVKRIGEKRMELPAGVQRYLDASTGKFKLVRTQGD